jgi:hypothetical protein
MGRADICDKRPLVYEMLATIDSHMWSRKPTVLCPQVLSVIEQEATAQDELATLYQLHTRSCVRTTVFI